MLKFTKEEKIKYAKQLRSPSTLPFSLPASCTDPLDRVKKKELLIDTRDGAKIKCYLVFPNNDKVGDALYINIHGGGYVQEHATYDDALCAVMAESLNCQVFDIDYRLAPEYPYPTGLNDCCDAVEWVFNHAEELNVDENKIALGGNSAGGTFTAGVCMKRVEEGKKVPSLAIMLYPACNTDYVELDANKLDLSDLNHRAFLYNNLYLENEEQYKDPYVSLILASEDMLKGFPDTVVVTAGLDPLCPGGEQFAKNLATSGSRIVLQRFLNSKHGFYLRCIGDEWQKARDMVFDEIRRKFSL